MREICRNIKLFYLEKSNQQLLLNLPSLALDGGITAIHAHALVAHAVAAAVPRIALALSCTHAQMVNIQHGGVGQALRIFDIHNSAFVPMTPNHHCDHPLAKSQSSAQSSCNSKRYTLAHLWPCCTRLCSSIRSPRAWLPLSEPPGLEGLFWRFCGDGVVGQCSIGLHNACASDRVVTSFRTGCRREGLAVHGHQ